MVWPRANCASSSAGGKTGRPKAKPGCEEADAGQRHAGALGSRARSLRTGLSGGPEVQEGQVILSALGPADPGQERTFDDAKARRQDRLMGALDRVNADLGTEHPALRRRGPLARLDAPLREPLSVLYDPVAGPAARAGLAQLPETFTEKSSPVTIHGLGFKLPRTDGRP